MSFKHLIEPNRILSKFVEEPIIAWTEINDKKLEAKRRRKLFFLNFIPFVKFTQPATVSVFCLTENSLYYINIGANNRLYESKVYNRTDIENFQVVKEMNESQKIISFSYGEENIELEILACPTMFKIHFGLYPEESDYQDFIEMTEFLFDEL